MSCSKMHLVVDSKEAGPGNDLYFIYASSELSREGSWIRFIKIR